MTLEADRREKMDRIRVLGLDPYGNSYLKFTSISEIRRDYNTGRYKCADKSEAPKFAVTGRVMLRRGMGKLSFLTIQGEGETIQVALDQSRLTDTRNALTKLIDLGDVIAAEGVLFPTQKGECTIWADNFFITAKNLVPPPDKVEGLKDIETRIRNRHIDLIDPNVFKVMRLRSDLVAQVRKFMRLFKFVEVETPIMQTSAGGAAAQPFVTHHNALDMDMVLRIAPELYLKRLLVGGFEKVYEIGKNFRNEGLSPRHNPEFTVMEVYEANSDYVGMMELLKRLMRSLMSVAEWGNSDHTSLAKFTTNGLFETTVVRLDTLVTTGDTLEEKYAIFEKEVAPTLIKPTFVTHMPKSLVPLAKESLEFPGTAEVFEFYMGGQEIAPGYTEENDPDAQLAAFKAQAKDGHVMDEDFIEVLKYGMPPAGGMGIGIDRLVALLTGQPSVRDVILFPTLRRTK